MKKYEIDVETDVVGIDEVEELNSALLETNEEIEKLDDSTKKLGKTQEKQEKQNKDGVKNTKNMGKAFKGVGTAMKVAFGGVILGAITILFDLLKQNQAVLDFFSTAFNTISIIAGKIGEQIGPLSEKLTSLFNNPLESLKEFGKFIQQYVINYFEQIFSAVGHLGSALMDLFSGDFAGALEEVKAAGLDVIDAYVGVAEGGLDLVKEVVGGIIDEVSEAISAGQDLTALQNKVKIGEAELNKIRVQGEMQAERLRQIRDDEAKSIDERIMANEMLNEGLVKQGELEKSLAQDKLALAKAELAINNNIENQIKLKDAQTAILEIENRILGQQSEYLANVNGLIRERLELLKIETDGKAALMDIEEQIAILQEKDAKNKLDIQKQYLNERYKMDEIALMKEFADTTAGTARYEEKVQAFLALDKQYELDSLQIVKDGEQLKQDEKDKALLSEQERIKTILEMQRSELENAAGMLNDITGTYLGSLFLMVNDFAKATNMTSEESTKAIMAIASTAFSIGAQIANQIASEIDTSTREGFEKQKQARVAGAIMSSFAAAIAGMLAGLEAGGPWGIALGVVTAAASLAFGLKQVDNIKKQKFGGTGSTGGGGGFNVPSLQPNSSISQPSDPQVGQLSGIQVSLNKPVKAYTIGNEVETQMAVDRNVRSNAAF